MIIPDGSAFPFEIKQYGAPTGEGNDQGKDVAVIKIEVKNAPILKLADSDKVQLQDHVTVIGYPGAADTFNSGLLSSKSALEATINDGKISAKKTGYEWRSDSADEHAGNTRKLRRTSIERRERSDRSAHVSRRHSERPGSFGILFHRSFKHGDGVCEERRRDQRSKVQLTQLFREGLDYYWDQYYSSAIPKFEEVKRLFPQHSEVDRLVQSSQQAKAEGKEKSSFPVWIVGVIVVVVLFADPAA